MLTDRIDIVVLKNLLFNDYYCKKVLPSLSEEYFSDIGEQVFFSHLKDFVLKFRGLPTKDALLIAISSDKRLNDEKYKEVQEFVNELQPEEVNDDWLLTETEKFCKKRAFSNALFKCVEITEGKIKGVDVGAAPKIMQDALSVCFDPNVGHDYLESWEDRYNSYHDEKQKIAFDLKLLNKITMGGCERKTLNIIMAGTGVGKSLFMCHLAAAYLNQGKNVLYISLEMSEAMISQRIDANLMNTSVQDLMKLSMGEFSNRFQKLKSKCQGKLFVKEYPTASANVTHFRHLINEIHLKRNVKIDVVFVDYLNIAASARVKAEQNANSYTIVKSIAEELRGLATETETVCWSATQTTRAGYASDDPGLEDVSESFGIAYTADLFFSIVKTDELTAANMLKVKQLKNRYNDPNSPKSFTLGIDSSKFRLFDVDQDTVKETIIKRKGKKEQAEADAKEVDNEHAGGFANTKFGRGMKAERGHSGAKFDPTKMGDINF